MACDYYRGKSWDYVSKYLEKHLSPSVRALLDEFVKAVLEELAEEVLRQLSDSTKKRVKRIKKKNKTAYAIEIYYLNAKRQSRGMYRTYTQADRRQYNWKTEAFIHWLIEVGVPEDWKPGHGDSTLRISTQVAYSALFDKFFLMGIINIALPAGIFVQKEIDPDHDKSGGEKKDLGKIKREIEVLRKTNEKVSDLLTDVLTSMAELADTTRQVRSQIEELEQRLTFDQAKDKVLARSSVNGG